MKATEIVLELGAVIKVFRNAEAPAVIKICFSVEPEEAKVTCKNLKVVVDE